MKHVVDNIPQVKYTCSFALKLEYDMKESESIIYLMDDIMF